MQNSFVNPQPSSTGQEILSTVYKVSGWNLRLRAIGTIITGIIIILAGIVFSIALKTVGFLIFSLFGLIVLFAGWLIWKRSKSLIIGRFY